MSLRETICAADVGEGSLAEHPIELKGRSAPTSVGHEALSKGVLLPGSNTLTRIELAVIALSRHDPLPQAKEQGRFSALVFGRRPQLALANPRLEALRRYAIVVRLTRGVPQEAERARVLNAGFDPTQIAEIDRLLL